MIIYKITNKENGKMYIGQTINSIEDRWHRHCSDAMNNILDTHFARAIRLYGIDNFSYEIIDTASTQEELTAKEQYWIRYYNSVNEGYNETDATYKSGGNTYKKKTEEELKVIKEKISQSKLGGNNPNATGVKCRNINTNEEYHFGSQSEMQSFFNETNHQFCSRRCRGEISCLYKNEWMIAYENQDYNLDFHIKGETRRKGSQIIFTDLEAHKSYTFRSYREAERELLKLGYCNIPSRARMARIAKGETQQLPQFRFELTE